MDKAQLGERRSQSQNWGGDKNGLLSKCLFPLSPFQLALGAALVNVQIPLLLGQLVEIVAKYMRDRVGSFVSESRRLSTQLLLLYGVQVQWGRRAWGSQQPSWGLPEYQASLTGIDDLRIPTAAVPHW